MRAPRYLSRISRVPLLSNTGRRAIALNNGRLSVWCKKPRAGWTRDELLDQGRPLISRDGFVAEQFSEHGLVREPGRKDRGQNQVDFIVFEFRQFVDQE